MKKTRLLRSWRLRHSAQLSGPRRRGQSERGAGAAVARRRAAERRGQSAGRARMRRLPRSEPRHVQARGRGKLGRDRERHGGARREGDGRGAEDRSPRTSRSTSTARGTFSPLQGMGAAAAARDDQQLFAAGREIYQTLCSVCHQPDGRGRDRVAPPLVGAALAMGPPAIAVRIMLHGKRGPANVMPALGTLMTDEQIAAALTYVRREWGQTGSAIQPATVKDIRGATAGRARPWTAEELQQFGGQSGKGAPYD